MAAAFLEPENRLLIFNAEHTYPITDYFTINLKVLSGNHESQHPNRHEGSLGIYHLTVGKQTWFLDFSI